MTIYKVQHGSTVVEFLTSEAAQTYATTHGLDSPTSFEKSTGGSAYDSILSEVKSRQIEATKVLSEIYASNIASGITTAQSDQMFDDFGDVLNRVREGAFETAILRLESKSPAGFVTQGMIDSWITTLESYL